MFFSFEKSVGAVIFRRENNTVKYLILLYPHGHWGFPKGHTEEKETNEETLKREVQEETAITELKIIPGFCEKEKYFYLARGEEKEKRKRKGRGILVFKKVYYYLAETNQTKIEVSHEHEGYEWLEFSEALKKVTYRQAKNILIRAKFLLSADKFYYKIYL